MSGLKEIERKVDGLAKEFGEYDYERREKLPELVPGGDGFVDAQGKEEEEIAVDHGFKVRPLTTNYVPIKNGYKTPVTVLNVKEKGVALSVSAHKLGWQREPMVTISREALDYEDSRRTNPVIDQQSFSKQQGIQMPVSTLKALISLGPALLHQIDVVEKIAAHMGGAELPRS